MKFTGYIEGYYGNLLTPEARKGLIKKCAEQNLSHYLFAAKEDFFHRVGWAEQLSDSYTEQLCEYFKLANEVGVTFIPALGPGLSYLYDDVSYEKLQKRVAGYEKCGATSFALLMDDITVELPESYTGEAQNLAELHVMLIEKLQADFPKMELLFCPTIYTDLLNSDETSQEYLNILAAKLPKEVYLFWTGAHTIAQIIDNKSCGAVANQFPGRVIFWDNIYSNDYCPTRLFLGKYPHRDRNFIEHECAGVMINPTGLPLTDALLLDIFSSWVEGKELSDEQYVEILQAHEVPEWYEAVMPWFNTPYAPANAEALLTISDSPLAYFDRFIVDWQHPLKREWYPYLHHLFTEIKLLTGKTIRGDEWFSMRFPPALAERLERGME